jgi:hypothetical protein
LIHGPYYGEYLPDVIREIASRYGADGFSDNSWSANSRLQIDYSVHGRRTLREATALELPIRTDWDAPVYRRWIKFSYARRLEVWEINNRASREAGGPDCCWVGMNSGELIRQMASAWDAERTASDRDRCVDRGHVCCSARRSAS